MSYVGSYSVGGSYSIITLSKEYTTIDELLIQLPNNANYEIDPSDIRDSIYTLWERINNVSIIASQSASASSNAYFTNSLPVPVTIGGIESVTTFSGTNSMQYMWDSLLYPHINPSVYLSVNLNYINREFGASTIVDLRWVASENTSNIQSPIVVGGNSISYTGPSQSGQYLTSSVNIDTTFYMSVTDINGKSSTASVNVSWYNAVYWGYYSPPGGTPSLPPMNILLPANKPSWANGASVTRSDINGVGQNGKALYNTKVGNYDGIYGSGSNLVFAWPSSFGYPIFKVDGVVNNAFTLVGNSITFTNFYGYTHSYDVWMSDTAQNSPITYFEIN
jgi:hypothetical protein